MSRTSLVALGAAVTAALALACSSDSKGGGGKKDAGTGGATGGAGGAAGEPICPGNAPPECCDESLPVMVVRNADDELVAPDWSCITGGGSGGGGAAGAGGAEGGVVQYRFAVEDFGGSGLVPDVEVELYGGNGIVDETPIVTAFTKGPAHPYDGVDGLNFGEFFYDAMGATVLSYRVNEKPGVAKRFVGFNYPIVAPPGRNDGATLTPALYDQLASFAVPLPNWSPPEDLGMMAAPIRDCAENDVGGAIFRFLDGATGQEIETGEGERDVRYIFFDGSYPNPKCNHTDYRQSLALIANAQSNAEGETKGRELILEFSGRLTEADTEPKVFARQSVEIFANSVNVYNIPPNVAQ